MSLELALLLGSFALLVLIDAPIAVALGLASAVYLAVADMAPMMVVAQRMIAGIDSFTLLAIPLFLMAGLLMVHGGLAPRIVNLFAAMVGRTTGGLAIVMVAACMMFGSLSGSGVADVVAIGTMMLPSMKARGYDPAFSAAALGCAGSLGTVIPPSIVLIVYGTATNSSIGDLFVGAIIPGLLLALALSITAWLVARKRGYPTEPFPGFGRVGYYLLQSLPGMLLIAIIFGGVRSGMFTATESSCVAVVYALLVTALVYRSMSWRDFVHATQQAVRTTAMVLLIIGMAGAFGWLMAYLHVAQISLNWMQSVSDNPFVILLMINVVLLVLGTFMDMSPLIIITTPIFLPVVSAFGVDPVHFGVIMILNLGIGLNTPPLGPVQFVAAAVARISIWEAMRSVWPFYAAGLVVLLMVTYIPALSLWLPGVFR